VRDDQGLALRVDVKVPLLTSRRVLLVRQPAVLADIHFRRLRSRRQIDKRHSRDDRRLGLCAQGAALLRALRSQQGPQAMSRQVSAAIVASCVAMSAFALWAGAIRPQSDDGCAGSKCGSELASRAARRSLGLIDL
jgi:hypothetical protein